MKSIKGHEDEYIDTYIKWLDFLKQNHQEYDAEMFKDNFQNAKFEKGKLTFVYDSILNKKLRDGMINIENDDGEVNLSSEFDFAK